MNIMNQVIYDYLQELSEATHLNEPKKIKMSPNLFLLLSGEFVFENRLFEPLFEMTRGTWRDIPVEIDRDLFDYTYELVY